MAEEEEVSLGLGDGLSPYAERKGAGGAAEDGNKMVLPELDGLFGDDGGFIFGGSFVINNLVFWVEAGRAHAVDCIRAGGNHGVLGLAGKGIDPSCVAVYFV